MAELSFLKQHKPSFLRMTNTVSYGVKNLKMSGAVELRKSNLLQKENPN